LAMPSPSSLPADQAAQVIQRVEDVLPIDQIFPGGALLLGGAVLLGVVLVHGVLMRSAQAHVARHEPGIRCAPAEWKVDLVMVSVVLILLGAALVEVLAWTAALKFAGVLPAWTTAATFAASSYTTLGDATRVPPPGWRMLGPIIAISGLFTFGWSGSVLVEVTRRLGTLRDLAREERRKPTTRDGSVSST
jgi:hypothetical protein